MKLTEHQLRNIVRSAVRDLLSEGLSDLYSKDGMRLPSKADRKKVAIFLKMKGAEGYAGSGTQNIELEKLIKAAGGPKEVHKKMKAGGSQEGKPAKPGDAKPEAKPGGAPASGSTQAHVVGFVIGAMKPKQFARKTEKWRATYPRTKPFVNKRAAGLMKAQVKAETKRGIQNVMVSMFQKTKKLKGAGDIGVRVDLILSPGEPLQKGAASKVAGIGLRVIAKMAGVKGNHLQLIKVGHRPGDAPISKKLMG